MKKVFLLGLILMTFAGAAQAAVVYFKDGGRVNGTIESSNAWEIQVRTDTGLITIGTERIARIEYVEPAPSVTPVAVQQPTLVAPPVEYVRVRREPANCDSLRNYFSLGFGVFAPLSDVDFSSTGGGRDSNGNAGFLMSTQYLYAFTSHLSAGMNLEFANRSATRSHNLLPFSDTNVYGNSVMFLPSVKYSFIDAGHVRPYVLGGVGAHRTSTVIEAQPQPGFAWSDTETDEPRTLVDEAHWGLATTARVGLDFSWYDPSVFTLEFGWTRLGGTAYGATPAGQDLGLHSVTGNQNDFVFAARWGWKF